MANPNEYSFQGDGIHAAYFPQGSGPIGPEGAVFFSYQDSHTSKTFNKAETVETTIDGVGTLVTVVLTENPISHSHTSFSVLVPEVGVAAGSPQTFRTKGNYDNPRRHPRRADCFPSSANIQGRAAERYGQFGPPTRLRVGKASPWRDPHHR